MYNTCRFNRFKAKGPAKENIDMKKCEAYEAVKMSRSDREYENVNTMS